MDSLDDLARIPQSLMDDVKTTLHNASDEVWKTKMNEVADMYKAQLATSLQPVLSEIETVLLKNLRQVQFDVSKIEQRNEEAKRQQQEQKEAEEKRREDELEKKKNDKSVDLLQEYPEPSTSVNAVVPAASSGDRNFLASLLAGAKDILRIQVDKRVQEFVDRQFQYFQQNFEKDVKDRLVQATEEFFTQFFLSIYAKSQQRPEENKDEKPIEKNPKRGGFQSRHLFARKRLKLAGPQSDVRLY